MTATPSSSLSPSAPASQDVIPLVDLGAQHAALWPELEAAMHAVVRRSAFINGEEVRLFEQEFGAMCGVAAAAGCASGTAALHLALVALGIGPGDEVITVPNTFIATTEVMREVGARFVFVDVDSRTQQMDVSQVEAAITPHTRAIVPVHLFGIPVDMPALLPIAARHGIPVIEDACQAHGAAVLVDGEWRRAGSLGALAAFSFYPGKNIGALGDAGIVTGNDVALVTRIRNLANHGRAAKYEHDLDGYGYRLDTLQAAFLRVKLRYLLGWNDRRRQIAQDYTEGLAGLPLGLPHVPDDVVPAFHLYVVTTPERDRLRDHLKSRKIETGIHYPLPLHLQPVYRDLGFRRGQFPVTERLSREILSLPIYPEMADDQIARVVCAVREFFGQ